MVQLRLLATLATLAVAVLAASLAARDARAQTNPAVPGGAAGRGKVTLDRNDFIIELYEGDGKRRIAEVDIPLRLSRAHCECETPLQIQVSHSAAGQAKLRSVSTTLGEIRGLLGTVECVSTVTSVAGPAEMAGKCVRLGTIPDGRMILNRHPFKTTVRKLFEAANPGNANPCTSDRVTNFWIWMDLDRLGDSDTEQSPTLQLPLDGTGPAAPDGVRVTGADGALSVSWNPPGNANELGGFVLFCTRGDQDPVFKSPWRINQLQTAAKICPNGPVPTAQPLELSRDALVETGGGLEAAGDALLPHDDDLEVSRRSLTGTDGGVKDGGFDVVAPAPIKTQQPGFVCSGLISATSTSHRIQGLENGVPYLVAVAALDRNGNTSPTDVAWAQQPIPTTDFYEGYRAVGGEATGGYCATAGPGRGLAALEALAAFAAAALAWSRSRRGRASAAKERA
jgi:hypothetical protein